MKLKFLFILAIVLISCESEENELGPNFADSNPNDVEIRIANKSSFIIDSVYLNTSGGEHNYNSIRKFQTTGYKSFDFAYPIFNLKFYVNAKEFQITPIDYVGEEKIDNGRYTLEVKNVDTSNVSFTFQLKEN